MDNLKNFEERHPKTLRILFLVILGIGIALRCYQYCMGRSLWEDEAHLALNFMSHGYADLLKPLDYVQVAPPLFLFSVKFFTTLFGYGPLALRAVPFLVSILTLPLFYYILVEITKSRIAALVGFFTFSVNIAFIYFSSELKTYGIDVAVYLLLIYLITTSHKWVVQRRNQLLGIAGCLSILYSNISFILLFCMAIVLLMGWVKQKKIIVAECWVLAAWFFAFTFNYLVFIYHNPYTQLFKEGYSFAFPPLPLWGKDFSHFMEGSINEIFFTLLLYVSKSFHFAYLLLGLFLVALGHAVIKKQYRLLTLTCLPLLLHFCLSLFSIYPFWYRFLLYLMPGCMVLMSLGLIVVVRFVANKLHLMAGLMLIPVCCYFFTEQSLHQFPLWFREIKPVLGYINKNEPGKPLYITTPYTLYKYYSLTGYAKDSVYNRLEWNITPERYYKLVEKATSNYLLLHATDNSVDGYQQVMEDLKKKNLIVKEYDFKSYTVSEVKPLQSFSYGIDYSNFTAANVFILDGEKIIALWSNNPVITHCSLPKGKYNIALVSKGTAAGHVFPHLQVFINDTPIGAYTVGSNYGTQLFHFEQKADNAIGIKLMMDNDFQDTSKKEDRNAFIKNMVISPE
jgi:hypothetical protein